MGTGSFFDTGTGTGVGRGTGIDTGTGRVPFAPAVATRLPGPTRFERFLESFHRWRALLTLAFGSMIVAAALFAYRSQLDDRSAVEIDTAADAASDGGLTSRGGLGVDTTTAPAGPGTSPGSDPGRSDGPGRNAVPSLRTTTTVRGTQTISGGLGTSSTVRARSTTDTSVTRARPTSSTAPSVSSTVSSMVPPTASTDVPPESSTVSTDVPPGSSTVPSGGSPETDGPTPTVTTTASGPTAEVTSEARAGSPATAAQPVYIGDRVTFDNWNGPGARGIRVLLLADDDRDGVGAETLEVATTSSTGAYSFDPAPGCYVVSFVIPEALRVLDGEATRPVCLGSGEDDARVDLVITEVARIQAPSACEVQIGDNRFAGVEILEPSGSFAPSYAFYDRLGRFLFSTRRFGGPDDFEGGPTPSIEWTSSRNRFDESEVYSVAAENRDGGVSSLTRCRRLEV